MKVLIIGDGGREHTIAWKLHNNPKVTKIFSACGNGGIHSISRMTGIKSNDIENLKNFALKEKIDLTIVGPEEPLVQGIVDEFEKCNLRIFGPVQSAARLEGSKIFAKNFMKKYNIPTADFVVFDNFDYAKSYIEVNERYPVVIKADGLAAGKGVIIAKNRSEAIKAVEDMLTYKKFGEAGKKIIIEEFLAGFENSILCFVDGNVILPMVSAKDFKKIGEGDTGLNTGGMGAISPNPYMSAEDEKECSEKILIPVLNALKNEGINYKGILYFGLIKTHNSIKVLEFNCRFGDPETQVVLPRLKTDFLDVINAVIDGKLSEIKIEWSDDAFLTVVAASDGYPEYYEKGYLISGLENIKDSIVFHSGTKLENGKFFTNGGRVLSVTGFGKNIYEARNMAYSDMEKVLFGNKYFRKDI
ncbi:MAG: phosphoribosylamine--glycine ligase [Ignavibacteria bacterium]|nr:phosphoribosylamine--glycine ligase [Ignavibacteria bacterium]